MRDFYLQSGENFSPRSVARDAFLAGNDLLYLGNIASEDQNEDTYTATLEILDFFAQQYRADRTFAQAGGCSSIENPHSKVSHV